MIGRLTRDEDGIAMGLAVILIVIVGVMGAGLLVFVRNDLQAVVQVNQGQQAFEAADAGVQVARNEILSNACAESYDGAVAGVAIESNPCANSAESNWSYATVDDNDQAGKSIDFDGNDIYVVIRHLSPASSEDEAGSSCDIMNTSDTCFAPEIKGSYPDGRKYFQIESTGESDSGNARRKVEAIFYTEDSNFPRAFFATGNVDLKSSSTHLSGVSLFTNGDILDMPDDLFLNEGSQELDKHYEYWENPPWNNKARPTKLAGAGAEGEISYKKSSDKTAYYGTRDFDSNSGSVPGAWDFVDNAPWTGSNPSSTQETSEISYPFDPRSSFNLEFLKSYADSSPNSTYIKTSGTSHEINGANYPDPSTSDTTYIVEFTEDPGTVGYKVKSGGLRRGAIIVINGTIDPSNASKGFEGLFIIRDPKNKGLTYDHSGSFDLKGYVNVEGEMKLRGSTVATPLPEAFFDRPGFYGVRLWSWRELYE